jgi:hypothetical protein
MTAREVRLILFTAIFVAFVMLMANDNSLRVGRNVPLSNENCHLECGLLSGETQIACHYAEGKVIYILAPHIVQQIMAAKRVSYPILS